MTTWCFCVPCVTTWRMAEKSEAVIRREYPYLSPERVKALALGLSNPDAVPQLCLDDIAAYIRAALPSQEYE